MTRYFFMAFRCLVCHHDGVKDYTKTHMTQAKNIRKGIFPERLAEAMLANDLTQSKLAELSGVTQASISRYLNGTQEPRLAEVVEIAHTLGMSMDELCMPRRKPGREVNPWRTRFQDAEQKLAALKDAIAMLLRKY